ncbi:chaplin family protein [Streptomyces sp. NPDC058739]|uniref:chaplin n=1 Tax=Streptomyces sp. NPDC058739 TaxID=3346618 RepID=UPI0036A9939B
MRRVTRNGVIAVVAASGAMAAAGAAHADSAADGTTAGSPGAVSGNSIQLPVHIPVNACGNTVNVVGLLNPAVGNACANTSGPAHPDGPPPGAAAGGETEGSPGVISGNGVQLPVELPVNLSGNSLNAVGIGNPALGNESVNTPGRPQPPVKPEQPVEPERPTEAERPRPPRSHRGTPPAPEHDTAGNSALAHTGTDATLPAAAAGALLLGGLALHRGFRRRATD